MNRTPLYTHHNKQKKPRMGRYTALAVGLCALFLVAGCGYKGPLTLPPQQAALGTQKAPTSKTTVVHAATATPGVSSHPVGRNGGDPNLLT